MSKLHPPAYGGIRQRYSRTSAGAVERYLDPIRRTYCEFPFRLAYENWLLHFLDPEITSIRLGRDIPNYLQPATPVSRAGQMYTYRDIGPVIHRVVDDSLTAPAVHFLPPGIRVEVRTRAQIRACRRTLRSLDHARRLLAAHVDLALDQEGDLVQAALEAASSKRIRIDDALPRFVIDDQTMVTRLLVAALRAIARGECEIDWSAGPLNRATVVTVITAPLPSATTPAQGAEISSAHVLPGTSEPAAPQVVPFCGRHRPSRRRQS
jgi:hypothetical protein